MRKSSLLSLVGCLSLGLALNSLLDLAALASADDAPKAGGKITLADGKITLAAPAAWERKEPSVRIIEHEFAIPAAEGDPAPGRLTIMGAGGSVEANIDRWIGQFTQPDGKPSKERTTTETLTVDGQTVHVVDITGTYRDQRGPFAPATSHEDYRMLAAIISTEKSGRYFFKLYGPKKTVAAQEDAFRAMIQSLDVK